MVRYAIRKNGASVIIPMKITWYLESAFHTTPRIPPQSLNWAGLYHVEGTLNFSMGKTPTPVSANLSRIPTFTFPEEVALLPP
ncbi:hypothetical protein L3N51_01188 [Metallosphaera sp. J1]|nr:hypothetical protein [Metallosphaera javensis (ex Hofmann et al. 2022)]